MNEDNNKPQARKTLGETNTATHAIGKHPAAVALGRLGGLKGGRARAARLTPEERQKIARDAATARWQKRNSDE